MSDIEFGLQARIGCPLSRLRWLDLGSMHAAVPLTGAPLFLNWVNDSLLRLWLCLPSSRGGNDTEVLSLGLIACDDPLCRNVLCQVCGGSPGPILLLRVSAGVARPNNDGNEAWRRL
eukprot:CAMPEP_0172690020 /NCGR_PEP_ID=MMETSP1074-20121228/23560_1 /TAXON_ID=2916 /ORGANISM="Ceratium fusus, Strain PA161109" /LENGTH=116 /DNA_ID=CAMNT_0013509915 /DNA_START=155 /DNA_END=506 /DNA_ORIENTATION=-